MISHLATGNLTRKYWCFVAFSGGARFLTEAELVPGSNFLARASVATDIFGQPTTELRKIKQVTHMQSNRLKLNVSFALINIGRPIVPRMRA
jgi:hypothetical protein